MRVVGIDPGLARTGYAVLEDRGGRFVLLEAECLVTKPGVAFADRLVRIHEALCRVLDRHRPESAAVEELFFAKNARTAFAVGQARGVAVLAAAGRGLPVAEYTPMQVKQGVTGYGRASKKQVAAMVARILGMELPKQPADVTDAIAVSITHLHACRFKAKVKALRGPASIRRRRSE